MTRRTFLLAVPLLMASSADEEARKRKPPAPPPPPPPKPAPKPDKPRDGDVITPLDPNAHPELPGGKFYRLPRTR